MRRSRIPFLFAGGFVVGLVALANGQVGQVSRANRPSQAGPSSLVDRIGGRYTRTDVAQPESNTDVSSPASRVLGLPQRGAYGGGNDAAPTRVGSVYFPYGPNLITSTAIRPGAIWSASGFGMATAHFTPMGGWPARVPHRSSTPLTPQPERSLEFDSLLGLDSSRPPPPEETVDRSIWYKALEDSTQAAVSEDLREGLDEFRRATQMGVTWQTRHELLRTSQNKLQAVQLLSEEDYVPCLILAHVALERERYDGAIRCIAKAVARHPEFFSEGFLPAEYYGDYDQQAKRSRYLDTRLQLSLQGIAAAESVDMAVLEAYVAWVRQDTRDATRALDRAESAIQNGTAVEPDVRAVMSALRAGL